MPSAAPPRASLNPFRVVLTHRNFRIFWIGQTVSLVGTWMQSMAQGWLAYDLTGSVLLLALVSVATAVPIVFLSLPAGVFVDRHDKLRTVFAAQAVMLAEAAVLWWLTLTGRITIEWLVVLATVHGVASAVEIPARQALMIDLVGREDLRDAIALNSSGFNLARIVGPSLGALVIGTVGLAWCFGLNALSYAAVLGGLTLIRLPRWRPPAVRASPVQGILELVRYMRSTREVAALMGLVSVYAVFGVPYLTLMPVLARDQLGLGAGGYGLLLTCVGLGGLTGALALAALGSRIRRGALLVFASYGFALLLLVLSLVRLPSLAFVVLFFTGLTMILNGALANGLLQSIVPDAMRGRLMAAYSLVVVGLAQVFGALVAGAVAEAVGVDWAVGAGALVMLGYTVRALARTPELRRLL